ncbi:peptidase M76 family-domain-containing protein [Mucidula mucida]|nr:peptidase M76 family-domain-containing protein [Mucidula mucida]
MGRRDDLAERRRVCAEAQRAGCAALRGEQAVAAHLLADGHLSAAPPQPERVQGARAQPRLRPVLARHGRRIRLRARRRRLCANNFYSRRHLERTMCHELMHLYDECRFKVDWSNLRHLACSEIRANNLSGDCRFFSELNRGIVSFAAQHQECVRRRAIVSVTQNSNCPDEETARKVVNEVWESCLKTLDHLMRSTNRLPLLLCTNTRLEVTRLN